MDALVITHAADFDGIASAGLLMRKYGINGSSILFADYGEEELLRIEKLVKRKFIRGGTLFITDLGAEGSTAPGFSRIISHVKSRNGKVFWFDHHKWDSENLELLAKQCDKAVVGENEKFCASEITAAQIGLDDPFVKALLHMVHISDFALTPDNTKMRNIIGGYVLGLAYFRMQGQSAYLERAEQIAECISNGEIIPEFLQRASAKFSELNEERLDKMMKTVITGGVISIGFTPIVSTNDACQRIIKKTGSDIGCYINVDSDKVHLRSVKNDCSTLANRFGGGGHPHASGFSLTGRGTT